MDFLTYLVDFRIVIGAVAGAIVMFFVAQKNPEWIQSTYQKQRAVSMQGTEEVDKLKAKVQELEMSKLIEEKVKEALSKIKG